MRSLSSKRCGWALHWHLEWELWNFLSGSAGHLIALVRTLCILRTRAKLCLKKGGFCNRTPVLARAKIPTLHNCRHGTPYKRHTYASVTPQCSSYSRCAIVKEVRIRKSSTRSWTMSRIYDVSHLQTITSSRQAPLEEIDDNVGDS